jgi:hypothetical protein
MQSPFEATVTITPLASSTVDAQKPVPTLAAFARCGDCNVTGSATSINPTVRVAKLDRKNVFFCRDCFGFFILGLLR